MILRLLRGRVIEGEESRLERFVRDEAIVQALSIPGLLSFQPAVRQLPGGRELVIISTWSGFNDMVAAGRSLDTPLAAPGAAPMLVESHAEHYELVIGQARSMPLHKAKLRLTRIPIRPNVEASYYQTVRRWADRLLDETGLVAFTLGRRVVGRQDEIVAVQIWQDEASLREAAGADVEAPMGGDELSQFWAAKPAIEHFDAVTAIEPRPDAPAILLADDQRRYVHATPAASRLSGRPLARLLTMRVEDVTRDSERDAVKEAWDRLLAEGSLEGPYRLARPDGSEVNVRFAIKANAPWPGSHASLLVPEEAEESSNGTGEAGDDLDIDRALVEAGLVARYART
ncbi:MAG TPA: PAS domain-containing protein [Candidatus Binatia bacterium]|nr:PAS domain-containing protein [Candidatus Binatia bacterium]